jgi:NAD(P)-dependent dehydrogenase (short-subunit alcohol dehydrogenase family)
MMPESKTILVTGANDGIGKETAKQLAALGHRLLVHARGEAKATQAAKALGLQSVPVWGDLSDMGQVLKLAAQAQSLAPKLDVLINNAGVYQDRRELTKDGFESTMGINHFSHMLLTLKLLPQLKAASAPRVVTVASGVHLGANLDLDDLGISRSWSPYGSYSTSKLANALFAAELAAQQGNWLLSFSLHPGVISTKLLHKGFGSGGASLESGAKTSVYCATRDGLDKYNGGYFSNSAPAAANSKVQDTKYRKEFWDKSLGLLKPWL